ncbi:RNA-directed DNA polymerase, eukaryota [Tanacetum coccineum]
MGATAHRNSFRSFEDHTQRISHSVYVTNFPDSVNSRDLWNSCSAYGTVIDVFIPVKKSKAGKRFAFVRFIKVNNLVRLVENLCTIWIGRHHLFANQVRYERPQKPYSPPNVKSGANIRPPGVSGLHQSNVRTGSYANIVNGAPIAKNKNSSFPVFDLPALILDETCANDGDLSRHVMIELNNVETKNDLLHHTGVKSWFHELQDGTFDFVSNKRIVWVDIEGIPLSVWSHATFSKIGKKWGELMDIEESAGSSFARKRICIKTNVAASILETFKVIFKGKTFMVHAKELFTWTPCFLEYKESEYAFDDELPRGVADIYFRDNSSPPISNGRNANDQEATQHSEDPFGFYNLLKKPHASTVLESDPSLTHPPGYTPEPSQQEIHNDASVHERGNRFESPIQKESPPLVPNTAKDPSITEPSSKFSTSFHSRKTHNGGSILDVLDDVIKILSLNVQGLGQKTKKDWVKELSIKHRVNFLALQETKMECISYMDVKFIWGNSNFQFVSSDSIGNSGGILCVWEQSIFKKDGATVSDNFIALYGTWLPTNTKILFVVIYAPQATVLKRTLWDYISTLANRWNGETIVLGDFNEVRSEEERFGSIFNQSSARAFNQFIASSGLIEVKMEGYSFTWSHPSASKMSKLDRFLVSDGIFLTFPSITAVCLDRHLSDHRPIFLNEIHADFRPTLFWFYHSWLEREGFDTVVTQAWQSFTHNDSNRIIRFKKKLQGLKQIIRVWIRESNRSQARVKKSLVDGLVAIDKDLDMGINSDDMLLRRLELTRKLHELKQSDRKDVAQKAKVQWAIEGDENSKYFHGIINKRRAQLGIRGVFVNGLWTTEPSSVKKAFVDHFANRFNQPMNAHLKLNMMFPNQLTPDQVEDLYRNIANDEIKAAVWACGENKSPDPDGYTFEFFRQYWDIIVTDAKFVTDFCPISLIGSVYKVITKILANRLSRVISDLVSNTQSAFVKDRQILDGPFILNEALVWCKRKKSQALTKAYDSVSSNMASILMNGSPTVEFLILCGLKQGDPLAPLLFILFIESLHISVSRSMNDGVFKGLHINDSTILSHLFYADHAIFLGEWSDDNLANLIRMLQCFQLASGLKINVHKSQVLGVGVHPDIVNQGASTFGCTVMHTPFKYLGKKKKTWVAWDKVLASKKQGGLSVSSYYALNRALLLKWVWQFISKDGSLWSRIISTLYGSSIEDHDPKRPSCWSSILREVQTLALKGFDFFSHIKIRVGNGHNTRFWRDSWLVDLPICTRFPCMYALERNKEILVAVKWGDPSFDHSFRRQARDGAESQQWAELLSLLGTFTLSPSIDRWVSDLNGEGLFRVKDFRSFLDDLLLPSSNMATRWVKCVPVKVNVFVWRARLERLPTRDNLAKRGVPIVSNLCPVCGSFPEDAHHLFFGCDLAKNIFLKICRWWNLSWAHVSSFVEWDIWFASIRLSSKLKSLLEGLFESENEDVKMEIWNVKLDYRWIMEKVDVGCAGDDSY